MRAKDVDMTTAVRRCWHGLKPEGMAPCPLLADLDRMLSYLEETGLKPGYTIDPCPGCGQEHSWALLDDLLSFALDLRPTTQTRLLQRAKCDREHDYQLYGGEEKYREYLRRADEFFASVKVKNYYRG